MPSSTVTVSSNVAPEAQLADLDAILSRAEAAVLRCDHEAMERTTAELDAWRQQVGDPAEQKDLVLLRARLERYASLCRLMSQTLEQSLQASGQGSRYQKTGHTVSAGPQAVLMEKYG